MKVLKDGHSSTFAYAVLTSNDQKMFSIGWDGKAIIWDMTTGQVDQTFVDDDTKKFFKCAISPDDRMAAATDYVGYLHIYDMVN